MLDMQIPIALVTALIMAPGAYFSYKNIGKGAGSISKYIFWFFFITLLTQLVALLQLLAIDPSTIEDFRVVHLVSYVNFVLIRVAYAVLAFGCYVVFRDSARHYDRAA